MDTKTFKIGEYALGGIIRATIKKDLVEIQALDWNTKKVVSQRDIYLNTPALYSSIDEYLNELTTSYYAGQILSWIRQSNS
jgi:hypothetical protein